MPSLQSNSKEDQRARGFSRKRPQNAMLKDANDKKAPFFVHLCGPCTGLRDKREPTSFHKQVESTSLENAAAAAAVGDEIVSPRESELAHHSSNISRTASENNVAATICGDHLHGADSDSLVKIQRSQSANPPGQDTPFTSMKVGTLNAPPSPPHYAIADVSLPTY
ncbi:hypothetical protein Ciccas_013698 [Cichlidogyrus casuarinus]|uniref:Uncharacterized protein n=1 Tax=Cichlidogyrus casuarinus TaxID=1844966 RepID=A0ABD2PM83_9PLAT